MKVYIIKKYVKATSAQDAIKKEAKKAVDEVYLHEQGTNEIGFRVADAIGVESYTGSSYSEVEEKAP